MTYDKIIVQETLSGDGSGAVAVWNANNISGTSLPDSSGNGNNMSLVGNPIIAEGKLGGKTIKFDGTNVKYAIVPQSNSLQIGAVGSFYFRMKSPNEAQTNAIIFSKMIYNVSSQLWVACMITGVGDSPNINLTGKKLSFSINNNTSGTLYYTTNDVVDGNYHDYVITINSGVFLFYVDGIQVPTVNYKNGETNINTTGADWLIGINGQNRTGSKLNGDIDFLKIYNRVLLPQEIAGISSSIPQLVGFWNGVNINGSTIYDRSYYNNTGSVSGSLASTNSKNGLSFYPKNASTYARIPNATQYAFGTGSFSLSLWINIKSYVLSGTVIKKSGNNQWGLIFSNTNPQRLVWYQYDNGNNPVAIFPVLDFNKWYKLDCVRDSVNKLNKVYVNGNLVGSQSFTTTANVTGADDISIGKELSNNTYHFDGYIDNIQLFNYARTFNELKQGNQLKLSITGNNVIGNTVYSTMGNNGTINGSTVSVVADSTGNGFSFTNSGYISVPSSNDYSFVSPTKDLPFTISFDMTTPSWLSDTIELGSNMYIMCKNTSSVYEWIVATAKVNGLYFIFLAVVNSNATSVMYQGFSLPSTNIYTHNIFTYDGTASPTSMTFTSNGVNMSRIIHINNGNYNGTSNRMSETGVPILIGSQPSPNNISDYRCKGVLNNIKIYKNQIGE